MKLQQLFPVLLLFTFPVCAQVQSQPEVNSLLMTASNALDHWQQLAPQIRCDDVIRTQSRKDCPSVVLGMGERVQEAKAQIVTYRQLSAPQPVDLFDAYESFRRVMELAETMPSVLDSYGEHNQQVLAETYNTFVKVNGWFGGVVRSSIENAARCSDHAHN